VPKKASSRLLKIQYILEKSCLDRIFMIFDFVGPKNFFLVPNLLFIGSQEAVKKISAKNRICHVKKVVEREK
jgi:hypothetical protein